jgi:hypothetical protein
MSAVRWLRPAVTLLACLLLVGCQTTPVPPPRADVVTEVVKSAEQIEDERRRELALAHWIDSLLRVQRVGWEVLSGAVEACPEDEVKARFGVVAMTRHDFGRELVAAAESAFGLGDAVQVLAVFGGSPAEHAGVAIGDVVRSVDDWEVPTGPNAQRELAEYYAELDADESPVTVVVERDGAELALEVAPVRACEYGVALRYFDRSINAYADGRNVIVTRGMERFAVRDAELAQVIAHEAAHNALSHRGKRQLFYLFGTILDIAVLFYGIDSQNLFGNLAAGVYSDEYEAEADHLGLYMTAMAGYPVTHAADFWRRMAEADPARAHRGGFLALHPVTPERVAAQAALTREIDTALATGQPLQPGIKP